MGSIIHHMYVCLCIYIYINKLSYTCTYALPFHVFAIMVYVYIHIYIHITIYKYIYIYLYFSISCIFATLTGLLFVEAFPRIAACSLFTSCDAKRCLKPSMSEGSVGGGVGSASGWKWSTNIHHARTHACKYMGPGFKNPFGRANINIYI